MKLIMFFVFQQHCGKVTMASDVCSHVKVVVRVRPANECEKQENCRNVVQVVDSHMLIFDPKEEDMSCFGSQRVRNRNINKRANKDLKFVFDHVFSEDSTQSDIFENTTKGVLDGVMNGFNCTGKNEASGRLKPLLQLFDFELSFTFPCNLFAFLIHSV